MLNEDKIRVMSRCAMYEKNIGKEDLEINRYYEGDYIRLNILKTLLGATIGFMLCVGIYLVMRMDYYMENIVNMDLVAFILDIVKYYVVVLAVFAVISFLFYRWKYSDAYNRVRWYYQDLKTLEAMNESKVNTHTAEDKKR